MRIGIGPIGKGKTKTTIEVVNAKGQWKVRIKREDENGGLWAIMCFDCKDESTCRMVACEVRDALNMTESPVGEYAEGK